MEDGRAAAQLERQRRIERHLPLVRALARPFAGRGEPLEDLVQVGTIGLIKAVDRYDPARGSLAAYAAPTIRGEILRYLRDRPAPVRVPRAEQRRGAAAVALPLDERLPAAGAGGEAELERGESRALVAAALRALEPRERRLLGLRYAAGLSQRGIAVELGLSQTHVSRLLRGSLEKLRAEVGAR